MNKSFIKPVKTDFLSDDNCLNVHIREFTFADLINLCKEPVAADSFSAYDPMLIDSHMN